MAFSFSSFVCCCACLSLISLSSATEWSPKSFPNPMVDVDRCGRGGKNSWICDPDGLIPSTADHVEGELKKIYAGISPFITKPCGTSGWQGFQVAVAVMGTFYMPPGSTAEDVQMEAERFAKALHDKWGVGNPECNNGILLLLAVYNRQVYLSTGAGVLPYLDNRAARNIIDSMKPKLRQKKYADAVDEAVVNIGMALAGHHIKPKDETGGGWVVAVFCGAIACMTACSCYAGFKNNRRYKTCKQRLEEIKRDQQAIKENRYVARTCPICLEPFQKEEGQTEAQTGGPSVGDDGQPSAPPVSTNENTPLLSTSDLRAAASAPSSSSKTFVNPLKKVKEPPARKALYLRCGHGFCEPCIAEWMKSKSSCPICRKDMDNDDPPQAQRPQPPHNCSDAYYQEMYYPELAYRMRRMHYFYPDYVTWSMMNSWEQDLENRRDLNTESMRQFELNDPATRAETTQMGSSGATTSWGGGSSSGGGGYGSSW